MLRPRRPLGSLLSNYIRIKDVLVCDGNDRFLHIVIDKYSEVLHKLLDTKQISYKIRRLNIQVMHRNKLTSPLVLIYIWHTSTGLYNT